MEHVLEDPKIGAAASSYIDDIFINELVLPVEQVVEHLTRYGLVAKPSERLGVIGSVRVLGLSVDSNLLWKRDGQITKILESISNTLLTRRQVHRYLGKWLGQFADV